MNDREALERLYADLGGIDGVPEHLLACLPRHKMDGVRAERAARLGHPAVAPILRHLLMWLQDCNWPVSHTIAPFLATIGEPLVEPIRAVLRSNDDVWKYGVVTELVQPSPVLRERLREDLRRLAESPTDGEIAEGLPALAIELSKSSR